MVGWAVTGVTELPPQNSVDSSPVASSRSPLKPGPDERGVRRASARSNRNGKRGQPRGPGRGGSYHALPGGQAGPRAALFELRLALVPRGREGGVGDAGAAQARALRVADFTDLTKYPIVLLNTMPLPQPPAVPFWGMPLQQCLSSPFRHGMDHRWALWLSRRSIGRPLPLTHIAGHGRRDKPASPDGPLPSGETGGATHGFFRSRANTRPLPHS